MRGERPPEQPLVVPPRGVVTRQSSDIVAIADTQVAAALRLIREHACHGLTVGELVDQVDLSRTALERRMREAIGRTPGEEIGRVRFARVRALLLETDLPLNAIAARCGMEHPQYMAEAFKKRFGMTPGTYRTRRLTAGRGYRGPGSLHRSAPRSAPGGSPRTRFPRIGCPVAAST
jgi:LacI family transcriptional regulator